MNFRGSRAVQWRSYRNTVFIHDIFRKLKKILLVHSVVGVGEIPFLSKLIHEDLNLEEYNFYYQKLPFITFPQNVYFYFFSRPQSSSSYPLFGSWVQGLFSPSC